MNIAMPMAHTSLRASSVADRLKIFELFHILSGDDMDDAWCMTAIQVWDLVVAASPWIPPPSHDVILACALISYRLTGELTVDQVCDGAAIHDDAIREKFFLKMGGEAVHLKDTQWQFITRMEEDIYKKIGSNVSRASFLDVALMVSIDAQEYAISNDVAVAAVPQVFQGWRLVMGEPITQHAQVTSMLVELAFMHLPHETYRLPTVVVASIAAIIAFSNFPTHPTVPQLRGYLMRKAQSAAPPSGRVCHIFLEKLIEVLQRTPWSPILAKWSSRAILSASLFKSSHLMFGDAVTPLPRKRLLKKQSPRVWRGEMDARVEAGQPEGARRPR